MATDDVPKAISNPADKPLSQLLSELRPGDFKTLICSIVGVVVVVFGAGVGFQRYFLPDIKVDATPAITTSAGPESAGALIVKKRKHEYVMLGVLHIPDGRGIVFSPPAGGTDEDESPTDTAIRETLEETGFTLKNVKLLDKAPAGNTNFSLVSAEIDDSVPPKDPDKHDGIGMIWADPTRIPLSDWRFPAQREWIVNHFQEQVSKLP